MHIETSFLHIKCKKICRLVYKTIHLCWIIFPRINGSRFEFLMISNTNLTSVWCFFDKSKNIIIIYEYNRKILWFLLIRDYYHGRNVNPINKKNGSLECGTAEGFKHLVLSLFHFFQPQPRTYQYFLHPILLKQALFHLPDEFSLQA